MALDYWKLGGKPSSYNPLPTGWVAILSLPVNSYVLTFRAKSQSGAQLRITDLGASDYDQSYTLTNDWKTYSLSFTVKSVKSYNVGFNDYSSKGDIIIDSIQLVQKPLPKLTINGIDGFLSGKWVFANGVTVIDDQNIVLNTSSLGQGSYILVNVTPNTDYVVQCTSNAEFAIYDNVPSAILLSYYNTSPRTFNSGNNSVIRLYLKNANVASGTFTFSKPMLNLGTTQAPYEPKRGDKMVIPVAKKNLLTIANYSYNGVANSSFWEDVTMNLVQGETYTASGLYSIFSDDDSVNDRVSLTLYYTDGTSTTVNNGMNTQIRDGVERFISISATANIAKTLNRIRVWHFDYSTVTSKMHRTARQVQLEQGTTATPYTLYTVQVNKKPKRLVPKKNLFDGIIEQGIYTSSVGSTLTKSANTLRDRSVNAIPVKANTNYIISVNGVPSSVNVFQADINNINNVAVTYSPTFTTASNTRSIYIYGNTGSLNNLQIEEGTTSTPYEPYQLVLPKTKTGLSFDGVKDYLQLPSMTIDSIEIECLIDSVQKNTLYACLVDARTGFSNSWAATDSVMSGWQSMLINGVDTSKSWANIPKNSRIKAKFNASSSFTDDVSLFVNYTHDPLSNLKGTLYKVTCYLNGAIVAQYDFENPRNIVGNQIIPSANNLIPSFEDSRWSIHPNAKVLGRDFLHLNATASNQFSIISIPVATNTNYFLSVNQFTKQTGYRIYVNTLNTNTPWSNALASIDETRQSISFNSGSSTIIYLYFYSSLGGSFDFIRPQLYQLSGQEGTINGAPKLLNAPAKRQVYAKR